MAEKSYGTIETYKGFDIMRFAEDMGEVFVVYDGVMQVSPDVETITEAKRYVDQNL